jgi:hypothetical protein
MAWFMPSYGRPGRLHELLDAPGGWPSQVLVCCNKDDPAVMEYAREMVELHKDGIKAPWVLCSMPAGSRCADVHRYISEHWPDEPYYGLLCDDHWPVTPGWYDALVIAAGNHCISTPAGEPLFPKLRNAMVLGGDLVRAMGSLVPLPVKHNFEDNCWDQIAEDFGILRPLPDYIVEHRHWMRDEAEKDATYERGSADIEEDARIFKEWLVSDERRQLSESVAKLVGTTVSMLDPKTIRLTIAAPTYTSIDPAYHHSISRLQVECMNAGLSMGEVASYGGSHIAKARERVLWDAMMRNPTHILFVDTDMGFEPKLVFRLLCADVEFACAVGVRKTEKQELCCNFLPGKQVLHPVNRFLKIRDVGFAFVLLKRVVIEKMVKAYPELAYNAGGGTEHALFLDMIDGGERLSEDYSFCRRWTAIGGEIWADRYAKLIHAGRKEYTGCIDEMFGGATNVSMDIVRAA